MLKKQPFSGRSVHNASDYFDEIRRDSRSDDRPEVGSAYLKQQTNQRYLEVSDHEGVGKVHYRRKDRAEV